MSQFIPSRLRTDHLKDPLGISDRQLRFSWVLEGDRRGLRQTAYKIVVKEEGQIVWDSGKNFSDASIAVPYEGVQLQSRQRLSWTVTVWDEHGVDAESESASFEMGLLQASDWSAAWISNPLRGGPRTTSPCPFFRKQIFLKSPIASARLYITALGLYEFKINGARVGDHELAPGWTDYLKRVRYQVYDVSLNLTVGPNALGAILGDGWYAGHVEWRDRQKYGDRPHLFAQLEVRYQDGTMQTFATDETWKTSVGPILESDMMMGESFDARLDFVDWDRVGFDEIGWIPSVVTKEIETELVATMEPPIRVVNEIRPVGPARKQQKWPVDDYIFDLGQNMVGRLRLKLKGTPGRTIKIRYAEILDADQRLYTQNLRSARATDYYTFKGLDEEIYESRFTFHGFRYVELSNLAETPPEDAVTGIVLSSDNEWIGDFKCSDPLINQLQQNIQWGWKGNSLDVPTDCPQRDERLGWTGDAQVFVRTAAFNADVTTFFEKYSQDLEDAQLKDGAIPSVAPATEIVGFDGGPAWADAVVVCPWTIYLTSGDPAILQRFYPSMQRFLKFLVGQSKDWIRCWPGMPGFGGFGDWLNIKAETPHELIGTAFFAYSAGLLSKIATILGKPEDALEYAQIRENVKLAFQHQFLTPAGRLASETQTAYLLGLHFDLLPAEARAPALSNLVWDIRKRGDHLSTGFVGSPYLNHVLTAERRDDVAFDLLHQKSHPSWLYAVTQGATTIWERWDGWTHDKGFQDPGMNSFNHYAYGAIGAWLYQVVAGIDLFEDGPGYKRILLRPTPGKGVTSASAAMISPYGKIQSDWAIVDGEFRWRFKVPANTIAEVWLPVEKAHVTDDGGLEFVNDELGRSKFHAVSGSFSIAANWQEKV